MSSGETMQGEGATALRRTQREGVGGSAWGSEGTRRPTTRWQQAATGRGMGTRGVGCRRPLTVGPHSSLFQDFPNGFKMPDFKIQKGIFLASKNLDKISTGRVDQEE
jgi:hypothetical protein